MERTLADDEIWILEVFKLLLGGGVGEIVDGPIPISGPLDSAKEVARRRMAGIVQHNLPGHAVHLLDGANEVYRWTWDDAVLAKARAEEIKARRQGKDHA
jgi:hypothetical protein